MSGHDFSTLIASMDIADLAGVSRSTVSNWKTREPDFPEPVGIIAGLPVYDRATIHKWLLARLERQVTESLENVVRCEKHLRTARTTQERVEQQLARFLSTQ